MKKLIEINLPTHSEDAQFLMRKLIVNSRINKVPIKVAAQFLGVSISQITSTWADFKANNEEGIKTKKLGRPLESNRKLSNLQSTDIKKIITDNYKKDRTSGNYVLKEGLSREVIANIDFIFKRIGYKKI